MTRLVYIYSWHKKDIQYITENCISYFSCFSINGHTLKPQNNSSPTSHVIFYLPFVLSPLDRISLRYFMPQILLSPLIYRFQGGRLLGVGIGWLYKKDIVILGDKIYCDTGTYHISWLKKQYMYTACISQKLHTRFPDSNFTHCKAHHSLQA